MTPEEGLAFVRSHGVVLESARGPVPSLAEAVAGEPLRGSWWGHSKGGDIFAVTRHVRASSEVLVCRLVSGKITFVHRRLWPALVRCAKQFSGRALARVRETHTETGKHVTETVPFPEWVPDDVTREAARLGEEPAMSSLGQWTRKRRR